MKKLSKDFVKCGVIGWCMEIAVTSLQAFRRREPTLTGHTSLFMFPIYGAACLLRPLCILMSGFHWAVRGWSICSAFSAENTSAAVSCKREGSAHGAMIIPVGMCASSSVSIMLRPGFASVLCSNASSWAGGAVPEIAGADKTRDPNCRPRALSTPVDSDIEHHPGAEKKAAQGGETVADKWKGQPGIGQQSGYHPQIDESLNCNQKSVSGAKQFPAYEFARHPTFWQSRAVRNNRKITAALPQKPSSSPRIAMMKSVCGSGI